MKKCFFSWLFLFSFNLFALCDSHYISLEQINQGLAPSLLAHDEHFQKWTQQNVDATFEWFVLDFPNQPSITFGKLGDRVLTEVDGDLFFANFYVNSRNHSPLFRYTDPQFFPSLIEAQPYLKWNGSSYDYVVGNAGKKVMESVVKNKRKVTLYRGMNQEEWKQIVEIRNNPKLKFIPKSKSNSIFLTPDIAVAKKFGGGKVVKMELSADEARSLYSEKKIYFGLESEYVEVALFEEKALSLYVERAELFVIP